MKKRVGIIGTGNMGAALVRGIAARIGGGEIVLMDVDAAKAQGLARELGAGVAQGYAELAASVEYLFLAVKPQGLDELLSALAGPLGACGKDAPVIVSIIAGAGIVRFEKGLAGAQLPGLQIIRLMPNTPALVGKGMIALAQGKNVQERQVACVEDLLAGTGLVDRVDEKLMDAVTAVSGSGPAYGFVFIDALADAGVRAGLPRPQALRFAAQTLLGAAAMVIETGKHPGELKDAVASPAGTTIEALAALDEHGFRASIHAAVAAAFEKAKSL